MLTIQIKVSKLQLLINQLKLFQKINTIIRTCVLSKLNLQYVQLLFTERLIKI